MIKIGQSTMESVYNYYQSYLLCINNCKNNVRGRKDLRQILCLGVAINRLVHLTCKLYVVMHFLLGRFKCHRSEDTVFK